MFDLNTRILVVDDAQISRKIIIEACQKLGFTKFIEASDGRAAWQALTADSSIGLIMADWMMPILSGIELLKKVRSDNQYKNLPFIMLTIESEQKSMMDAIMAGVTGYIIKPFTVDILREKLETLFLSQESSSEPV